MTKMENHVVKYNVDIRKLVILLKDSFNGKNRFHMVLYYR